MPREFAAFSPDLDTLIRERVAKECRFPDARAPDKYLLRGTPVAFYRNVWLAYLEPNRLDAENDRRYFLTRPRGRKDRIVPLANAIGSVDRANRRYKLTLTKGSFVDYLNFYYSFTPKDDPFLSRMPAGPTQFGVPRSVDDLRFAPKPTEPPSIEASRTTCSNECLARGAIWHFLDEQTHERIIPLRFKSKRVSPFNVSGRFPIQFRDALFATDFKVPQATGIPVLSNPELLYQSDILIEPEVLSGPTLLLPRAIKGKEWWRQIVAQVRVLAAKAGHRTLQALWWLLVIVLSYFWACSALFSVFEWAGYGLIRSQFAWWSRAFGIKDWSMTALLWTTTAIITYMWFIVLTTHRDKVFNWAFRLCPRHFQPLAMKVLNYFVARWDNSLIMQDTFRKRVWWSMVHLTVWTSYMVLAFASLQILLGLEFKQPSGTALLVSQTLLVQAMLNIPFVAFLLIQVFGLIEWLDPVVEGIVNYSLLACFQMVMAMVVFRGLYRVWVFTVEASPYTFFRRLRHNPGSQHS